MSERHADHSRWDDSGMAKLLKFSPTVVGIISFIFAVGIASTTLSNVKEKADKAEIVNDSQEKEIAVLKQSSVDTTKRLDRMEDKLDAILKAVK